MEKESQEIAERINSKLTSLENVQGVRILYACESGSRSWGFASSASDYNVRFLFVRPLTDYLKITPPPALIRLEQDGPLDISGYELRHALSLLKTGDTSIIQQLYSPIVYRSAPRFAADMRRLLGQASLTRLYWSYRSMAQVQMQLQILSRETIAYKTLLFVVQAVLAMRWIEVKHSIPPVVFGELLESVTDEKLKNEIETLVAIKTSSSGGETGAKSMFPSVLALIGETLAQTQPPQIEGDNDIEESALDALFLRWLGLGKTTHRTPQRRISSGK
jgi:predicted nucleotidyltransferase